MAEEDELDRAREVVRREARRRLVELGLTQEQLSIDQDVPLRTVSRFFTGGAWPRTPALRSIAVGLKWPPDELERRVERSLVGGKLSDLTSAIENVIVIDFGPHALDGLTPEEFRELQTGMEAAGVRMINEIKARTPGRGFPLVVGVAS